MHLRAAGAPPVCCGKLLAHAIPIAAMHQFVSVRRVAIALSTCILPLCAQQAPPSPDRPWPVPQDARFQAELASALAMTRPTVDPNHVYTLPELVDIAERNNPETRVYGSRQNSEPRLPESPGVPCTPPSPLWHRRRIASTHYS